MCRVRDDGPQVADPNNMRLEVEEVKTALRVRDALPGIEAESYDAFGE